MSALSTLISCFLFWEYLIQPVSGLIQASVIKQYSTCPRGCAACSPVNGCVACEGRLFMFLYRHNMQEVGICTPFCPVGYFGVRHQYYSKCYRCHIKHCRTCFTQHFCTVCEHPYLANEGQCIKYCPEGMYYANFTRECTDRVDCLTGAWSPWSVCSRNGQTCGYKWGVQSRTRPILQKASPNGISCPELSETQRCRLVRRYCNRDCSRRKRYRWKNKLKNKRRKRKWSKWARKRNNKRDRWRKGNRKRKSRIILHRKRKLRIHKSKICRGRNCEKHSKSKKCSRKMLPPKFDVLK